MHIAGIGMIFNRGRGIQSLKRSLEQGWAAPGNSVYAVPEDCLKDKSVLKDMRRADNFSKMACLAAYDALADSEIDAGQRQSLGIILATSFGPHVSTFRFLDDILDYSDANVSPTIFSHSVHNAAASYIAYALKVRGPTLTITQFVSSFHQAVLLAECWLKERRVEFVLAGTVDQCGKAMEYIASRNLRLADDGMIRPFVLAKQPAVVPGEGSTFFLLADQQTPKKYAHLSALPENGTEVPDLYVWDCDGMAGSEEVYRALTASGALISSYTPIFGSMFTVSSFNCAASALMLKDKRYYAAPVQDNPHKFNVCKHEQPAAIKSISCIRYGCKKEKLELFLKRG